MAITRLVDADDLTRTDDEFGDYLYEDKIFSGIAREKDPGTGAVIAVTGYRNGKLHGASRAWHPNGQLAEELFTYGGRYHGPQHIWYPNGRLKTAGYVDRNVAVWEMKWNEQGQLTNSFDAEQISEQVARLAEARRAYPRCPVIDIDLDTWEFVERPDGWRIDERP